MFFKFLILAAIATVINAAIDSDKVTSMPGFKGGVEGLPSTHYSVSFLFIYSKFIYVILNFLYTGLYSSW
jgi:hypothetical protein